MFFPRAPRLLVSTRALCLPACLCWRPPLFRQQGQRVYYRLTPRFLTGPRNNSVMYVSSNKVLSRVLCSRVVVVHNPRVTAVMFIFRGGGQSGGRRREKHGAWLAVRKSLTGTRYPAEPANNNNNNSQPVVPHAVAVMNAVSGSKKTDYHRFSVRCFESCTTFWFRRQRWRRHCFLTSVRSIKYTQVIPQGGRVRLGRINNMYSCPSGSVRGRFAVIVRVM